MKRKTASTNATPNAASVPIGPAFWAEVLRTCGSFNLRKATRVVTQLYDDILQPTGLRSTQVVLLVVLAVEGEMSMSYMARELIMAPSTLSRTLIPLERDGLIDITSNGKRGKLVRLTRRAKALWVAPSRIGKRHRKSFLSRLVLRPGRTSTRD
jgi:DNA-binding MarR family transcriptional regulator